MDALFHADPSLIDELYQRWHADPRSVPTEWWAFFEGYALGEDRRPAPATAPGSEEARKQAAVQALVHRYRDLGHLLACVDPLNPCPTDHPRLALSEFGLSSADLKTRFRTEQFVVTEGTLAEILAALHATYCRFLGVEFMHIQNPEERNWLIGHMEKNWNKTEFKKVERLKILEQLQQAGLFEAFLHRKFLGQKRFSLEGGETIIPLLHSLVERAAPAGVRDLVLGMAHRGRLNVLAHIFGKPYENIFAEFDDNLEFGFVGEGDVKYHKGFSNDRVIDGHSIHLTLASNPSHLEVVNPVVEGKARARQDYYDDSSGHAVLPVLIHGDAAFAGQGVVAETLNLSQLEGYRTGGTLHIVLNNQIGFTTRPQDARSTHYATDLAKMLAVPIFHVHGEQPEAAVHAARLAFDYRMAFGRDVVLEITCYRRHGHNEGDEPSFTQPLMYEKIRQRPPVHEVYAGDLQAQGVNEAEIAAVLARVQQQLEQSLGQPPRLFDEGFQAKWQHIDREYMPGAVDTGVAADRLRALAARMADLPADFSPHPKIARLVQERQSQIDSGRGINWGTAEVMAYATLLAEGRSIRLSGQDCRRGTFNHRHASLHDHRSGACYIPLQHLAADQARFQVWDSMLSEAAVLGFEYGYAAETPNGLTLWEAQFGDFANGAQVIIDQFIVSSETKWQRMSGLTLLLPHGYEGQGAEHSSARLERYLQLGAVNNIEVVVPSTPAQMFHLLRRQLHRNFRRPLVVLTPKSLLRHPACVSSLEQLSIGHFHEVLADTEVTADKVGRVLLCAGKIYYELAEYRAATGRDDVAIVRLEQLYPLSYKALGEALEPFSAAKEFVWVQEEPENNGAWMYLLPRLTRLFGREPDFVARPPSPAPAGGSHRLHALEQKQIIETAFGG